MSFNLFLSPGLAVLCLIGGILFGFLLRKGAVSRFDTIVGQLLLKDFTVMKVMLTAIVVGSIGIYSLNELGLIPAFHLSKTSVLFAVIGGAVFGVGMSIAGYCPGTAVAAIAEGSKDMIIGVLGMLCASVFFNEISPALLPAIEQPGFAYQQTLSSLFGVSHWVVIAGLVGVWIVFVFSVRKLEQKSV